MSTYLTIQSKFVQIFKLSNFKKVTDVLNLLTKTIVIYSIEMDLFKNV